MIQTRYRQPTPGKNVWPKAASLLLAISAMMLGGCNLVAEFQAKKEIEKAVRELLKDPESARFADTMRIDTQGATVMACGLINAKNSMGGYVGDRPFLYWQRTVFIASEDQAVATVRCCDLMMAGRAAKQSVWAQEAFWSTCGSLDRSSTSPFDFGKY